MKVRPNISFCVCDDVFLNCLFGLWFYASNMKELLQMRTEVPCPCLTQITPPGRMIELPLRRRRRHRWATTSRRTTREGPRRCHVINMRVPWGERREAQCNHGGWSNLARRQTMKEWKIRRMWKRIAGTKTSQSLDSWPIMLSAIKGGVRRGQGPWNNGNETRPALRGEIVAVLSVDPLSKKTQRESEIQSDVTQRSFQFFDRLWFSNAWGIFVLHISSRNFKVPHR